MQTYFYDLVDRLTASLTGGEVLISAFRAEDSDFVRFNKAKVRQAGRVQQRSIGLQLIEGRRHASVEVCLSGVMEDDLPRCQRQLERLRERRGFLPEDPHLLYSEEPTSSEHHGENSLPDGSEMVRDIQDSAQGRDLVGIHAAGGVHAGFANSLGQRNWFSTHSFNFDWSFHHSADKAVKSSHAGFEWKTDEFQRKLELSAEQLKVLGHPAKTLEPGGYRVYLAPPALNDIVDMVGSDSFGMKMQRTKQSPLIKLLEDEARLHPSLSITEATALGVAPNFQEAGFIRPSEVKLVDGGAPADCLISPRSAKEFGVETNGASAHEVPESIDVAAGKLPQDRVLEELGTGLWIGNVWYLNYSDRSSCRTTGMTRFATFWVENGQIQAPLNVMRFDETAYRMLGEQLVDMTAERDWILDPETYHRRSTRSARMPGALVDDFRLTL